MREDSNIYKHARQEYRFYEPDEITRCGDYKRKRKNVKKKDQSKRIPLALRSSVDFAAGSE